MSSFDILLDPSLNPKKTNTKITSAVEMGVSHLSANNPDKALDSFERVLETDTKIPSAWIGRAYALALSANTNSEENIPENWSTLAEDYLEKGLSLVPKTKQQVKDDISVIVLSYYVDYYASTIVKTVKLASESRREAAKAQRSANAALVTGLIGAAVAGGGSRTGTRMLGAATAAGGIVGSASKEGEAQKMQSIGESVFSTAIQLTLLSMPPVVGIYSKSKTVSKNVLTKINSSLDKWKESIIYLFTEQSNRVDEMVNNIIATLKKPKEAIQFVSNFENIQEVKNLALLTDSVGLDNHKSFEVLNSIQENLDQMDNKDEMIKDIETIKGKRIQGWVGYFICMCLGMVTVESIGLLFFIGAVACAIYAIVAKSDTQNKLIEIFNILKMNKSVFANVKAEDIDYDALGVQN